MKIKDMDRDKPVIIQVRAAQWTNGEAMPNIRLTTEGVLRNNEGTWEVHYDESEATGMEGTRTMIAISPSGAIRMERRGTVEMDMIFREGQNHRSQITMPYGILSFQLTTNEARGSLNEQGGSVSLSYALDFDADSVISTTLLLLVQAQDGLTIQGTSPAGLQ